MLQWLHANGCPWDVWTCAKAGEGGHLAVLKWAITNQPHRDKGTRCDWRHWDRLCCPMRNPPEHVPETEDDEWRCWEYMCYGDPTRTPDDVSETDE